MIKKFGVFSLLLAFVLVLGSFWVFSSVIAITIAILDIYTISNTVISPNNSTSVGTLDDTSIDIRFSSQVTDVSMDIIDNLGGQIKHVYTGTDVTNPLPKLWDGKDTDGSFVNDGNYIVQIVYADAGGIATDTSKTITVDNTSPIITLLGAISTDIEVGSVYTDAGATALDNINGDITANIVAVNSVNTSVIGTYSVTYNVSDSVANIATEITRTVNVVAVSEVVPVPIVEPVVDNGGHSSGYIPGWGPNGQIGITGQVLGATAGQVLGASTVNVQELARQKRLRYLKWRLNHIKIRIYNLKHPQTTTATSITSGLNSTTTNSTGSTSSPTATATKPFWKFW